MQRVRTVPGGWLSAVVAILLLWNALLTAALVRHDPPPSAARPRSVASAVNLGHRWAIESSTLMMNGAPDYVLAWGYNVTEGGARQDDAYPQFRQSLEQRYQDSGGHAFTEWNLDFLSADGQTLRRPVAVAVELPTFHVSPNDVHITTASTVSLSLAADEEEFRNGDHSVTRLAINDAGIGIGSDPGSSRNQTKVMVYRHGDTNAIYELRSDLAGEKVWQWRYDTGLGAPPGSVAFYNSTDQIVGPVVLSDGVVETGTEQFRYREPLLRVTQSTPQDIAPRVETVIRFAGSTQGLTTVVAGNYVLVGGVASMDGRRMFARIRVNGAIVAADKGTVFGLYRLASGDTVSLAAEQKSPNVEHTSGDAQTFLSMVYVGE